MSFERWHPVTHDMGLINASVERTVAELRTWHESIGTTYVRTDIVSGLLSAFQMLPPLSQEKRRRLFVETAAGWTACFQSGIQGSDPTPAMSILAERLRVLSMRVCATPPSAKWPAHTWEVFAPEELGGSPPRGVLRSISAANDGGSWRFHDEGRRFQFEKPELYMLPTKRDRFTRVLLEDYLQHFNLMPFSEKFYVVSAKQPAVLLESSRRWKTPPKEFTLEEVLTGLPWKRG